MRGLFLLGFILVLLLGGVEAQEPEYKAYLPLVVRRPSPPPVCRMYYWVDANCGGYWTACVVRWMAYLWPEGCPEIESFTVEALYKPPPWDQHYVWWLPDCCFEKCVGDTYGACEGWLWPDSFYSFGVYARIPGYETTLLDWTQWVKPEQGPSLCNPCDLTLAAIDVVGKTIKVGQ